MTPGVAEAPYKIFGSEVVQVSSLALARVVSVLVVRVLYREHSWGHSQRSARRHQGVSGPFVGH